MDTPLHYQLQNSVAGKSDFQTTQENSATVQGNFNLVDKQLQIDPAEIEEEEKNASRLLNTKYITYSTVTFYLLAILFLFNYLKNSANLHKLFSFTPYTNRRFALFQVFRI